MTGLVKFLFRWVVVSYKMSARCLVKASRGQPSQKKSWQLHPSSLEDGVKSPEDRLFPKRWLRKWILCFWVEGKQVWKKSDLVWLDLMTGFVKFSFRWVVVSYTMSARCLVKASRGQPFQKKSWHLHPGPLEAGVKSWWSDKQLMWGSPQTDSSERDGLVNGLCALR